MALLAVEFDDADGGRVPLHGGTKKLKIQKTTSMTPLKNEKKSIIQKGTCCPSSLAKLLTSYARQPNHLSHPELDL